MSLFSIVESPIFLWLCFVIFATAFFIYLYTALIMCQRKEVNETPKKLVVPVPIPQLMACKFDCLSDNWLIATELQQSPLNIEAHTQAYTLPMLNWVNHDVMPEKMILENNGETLVLHAVFTELEASVNGADLENHYNFVNICFRWGSDTSFGADHMLNSQTYPLEMQVMYHLGPIRHELSSRKLLMIAFLYEIGNFSEELELIIRNIHAVRQTGFGIKIEPFPLGAICPMCSGGFYCYIGTMTMPPYYEGLKWFVYSQPMTLSLAQLKEFHKVLGADMKPLVQEKRTAQNL